MLLSIDEKLELLKNNNFQCTIDLWDALSDKYFAVNVPKLIDELAEYKFKYDSCNK
jgi:hypothetical protein